MKVQPALKKCTQRLPAEFESDLKTVQYEPEMLLAIGKYATLDSSLPRELKNACVESFALHCRALILLLYGHLDKIEANGEVEKFAPRRDTDVLAVDFNREWESKYRPPTKVLVDSKRQADKHVAHITIDRRGVNQPGSEKESVWRIGDAVEAIRAAFLAFVENAENVDAAALATMRELVARATTTTTPAGSREAVAPPAAWPEVPRALLCGKTEPPAVLPNPIPQLAWAGRNSHGEDET
jgi:hypothetical protein